MSGPTWEPDIVFGTLLPSVHRTAEENLGLGYLASVLRDAGYAVKIVDAWLERLPAEKMVTRMLEAGVPGVIGISAYISNMKEALEVVRIVKTRVPDVPLLVGGPGPTFHPEAFLDAGFDVVVRGEAEELIEPLCRSLISGMALDPGIPNLVYSDREGNVVKTPLRPVTARLDQYPCPARDTLALAVHRRSLAHLATSRGCRGNCLFCSVSSFHHTTGNPKWRGRSIGSIGDELEYLARLGVRHVRIVDDSFIEPPRGRGWAGDLADEIVRRGLAFRFRCSLRADRIDDDLMAQLVRMGVFAVSCGVENFAPSALRRMEKTATAEQNLRALSVLRNHGVYVQAGLILFDHETTVDELLVNLEVLEAHDWIVAPGFASEMFAATGTRYTARLRQLGVLERDQGRHGNLTSTFANRRVKAVHAALQKWHGAHAELLYMAADPIGTPKALESDELQSFHRLHSQLWKRGLRFFRQTLELVDARGFCTKDLEELAEEQVNMSRSWRNKFSRKLAEEYRRANLNYDAAENPFLSIRSGMGVTSPC